MVNLPVSETNLLVFEQQFAHVVNVVVSQIQLKFIGCYTLGVDSLDIGFSLTKEELASKYKKSIDSN